MEPKHFTRVGADVVYPLLLVAAVLIPSAWARVQLDGTGADMSTHLGGEHRCIAEALAQGRGFSDPFGARTGPTAWMSPVFPALMAAVLMAFGSIEAVAAAVVTLQNVVLIYMGFIVLRFASGPSSPKGSPIVALAAYFMIVGYDYFYYFSLTHDHVMVGLWICLFVDFADRLWGRPPRLGAVALWGLAGGLSALTAPVLGPVWAALTMLLSAAAKRIWWIAASSLIACAVVAPWLARNAIVFHRLIPVKSNLAFELYQSQCLERDGVLRFATSASHPYRNLAGNERELYRQEGEIQYLDQKRRAFLRSVREGPASYLRRVGNRLAAATLVFDTYFGDAAPVVFAQRLIHPLPFAGLLLTLMAPGWRTDKRKIACIVIYIAYMLPYIVVSYYIRYVVALDIVKILFCLWGWQVVSARVLAWRRPGPIGPTRCGLSQSGSRTGPTIG